MEHILPLIIWPVAILLGVVALGGMFWRPLARLIDRMQRAKVGENAIEFSEHRGEQQAERQIEIAPPATTATANAVAISTTSTTPVAASHAMPPPHDAYSPIEELVRAALPKDRSPEVQEGLKAASSTRISASRLEMPSRP